VPVAFILGLVPHCDVSVTVLALVVAAEPLGDPLLLLLPHPATAATAITAASAAAPRVVGACSRVFTNPHLLVVRAGTKPLGRSADTTSTYDNA
jgi:hypothetical protein